MAESETRLETLEDEVRVLKGEVKRTLVDLRALLMREDSPLGEKVLTRRAANGVAQAADGVSLAGPAQKEDLGEAVPGTNGLPSGSLLSGLDFDVPVDDLPSGPPQAGPGPIPGPFASDGRPGQDDQSEAVEQMTDQLDSGLAGGTKGLEYSPDSPELNGRRHLPPDEGKQAANASVDTNTPTRDNRDNRANSIYDEYRELLAETRQTHILEDGPAGPPLDINLLSNLVYWTALAKQRVGEEQLKDILQLYIQSGHSRPELQDLLLQVSRMVDADPPGVREGPRGWVDLMFHLHGILTGGFPVIKLPPIRLSTYDDARDGQG